MRRKKRKIANFETKSDKWWCSVVLKLTIYIYSDKKNFNWRIILTQILNHLIYKCIIFLNAYLIIFWSIIILAPFITYDDQFYYLIAMFSLFVYPKNTTNRRNSLLHPKLFLLTNRIYYLKNYTSQIIIFPKCISKVVFKWNNLFFKIVIGKVIFQMFKLI